MHRTIDGSCYLSGWQMTVSTDKNLLNKENTMKKDKLVLLTLCLFIALPLQSCVVARPVAQPGPNFVWVAPRTFSGGAVVPGHWVYKGKPHRNKTWVPGHYGPRGRWIEGRWRTLKAPRKNAVWVPGHWSKKGRWVDGHWRTR